MESNNPLSSGERLELIQTLGRLPSTQFGELIIALNPPGGSVSPSSAPQSRRASELMQWVEGPSGPGLPKLQKLLEKILVKDASHNYSHPDESTQKSQQNDVSLELNSSSNEKTIHNSQTPQPLVIIGIIFALTTLATIVLLIFNYARNQTTSTPVPAGRIQPNSSRDQLPTENEVTAIDLSSDNSYIAFADTDGNIYGGDLVATNDAYQFSASYQPLSINNDSDIQKITGLVFKTEVSNPFFITYRRDGFGKVKQIDIHQNNEIVCSLQGSQAGDYYLATNNDPTKPFLAIASSSAKAPNIYALSIRQDINCERFLDLRAERMPEPDADPGEGAVDIDFRPNHSNLTFASAHGNGEIYLWKINPPNTNINNDSNTVGLALEPWSSDLQDISSISFSPNGKLIAIGYASGDIKILEILDNEKKIELRKEQPPSNDGHTKGKVFVDFKDDQTLISLGKSGKLDEGYVIRQWSLDNIGSGSTGMTLVSTQPTCYEEVSAITFDSEKANILIAGRTGKKHQDFLYFLQLLNLSAQPQTCTP